MILLKKIFYAKYTLLKNAKKLQNKEMVFAKPFYPGEDEAKDFERIINFFAPIQAKHPELGLSHLQNEIPAS